MRTVQVGMTNAMCDRTGNGAIVRQGATSHAPEKRVTPRPIDRRVKRTVLRRQCGKKSDIKKRTKPMYKKKKRLSFAVRAIVAPPTITLTSARRHLRVRGILSSGRRPSFNYYLFFVFFLSYSSESVLRHTRTAAAAVVGCPFIVVVTVFFFLSSFNL